MSKRPAIDLSALTSEAAIPMPEASQRAAHTAPAPLAMVPPSPAPSTTLASSATATSKPGARGKAAPAAAEPEAIGRTKTMDLQPLAFKVPPAFRKRFRQAAAASDLKLNELLFEAFAVWEEKMNSRK